MTYQSFDPYSAWDLAIDLEATGKAWRRKRKERHLSQDGLSEIFCAADMPMSKAAISAVENGKHLPQFIICFSSLDSVNAKLKTWSLHTDALGSLTTLTRSIPLNLI